MVPIPCVAKSSSTTDSRSTATEAPVRMMVRELARRSRGGAASEVFGNLSVRWSLDRRHCGKRLSRDSAGTCEWCCFSFASFVESFWHYSVILLSWLKFEAEFDAFLYIELCLISNYISIPVVFYISRFYCRFERNVHYPTINWQSSALFT